MASGVLLWLASPPVGFGALAWVALVPAAAVSLALPGTRLARAAVPLAFGVYLELLLVPAFPFGLARDQWGDPVLPVLVGDSPVLVIALLLVPLAGLLLYALRFPQPLSLERPGHITTALVAVLVPASAWTALDLLRTKYDPGGVWGPLFLSQEGSPAAGLGALAGPWALTFALVAVNYTLALGIVAKPRDRHLALAPAAVVLALLLPSLVLPSGEGGRRIRVAAIQPGYDTAEFDLPVNHFLRSRFRDLERASVDLVRDLAPLTREAAERGAGLAVWPEATLWVDPATNERIRQLLRNVAADTGLVLVVPYFLRGPDHGAAVLVLPDGTITRSQPKQRPMWFLGERGGNRSSPRPVDAHTIRVGTLLGVDNQDPAWPRNLAARGAGLLTSSTHDWAALADQQVALSRLHAVALRVPFVRADWRYGSAIVGADGATLASAGFEKRRTVLVADVVTGSQATLYTRVGDIFGWLCVAALAPLGLLALRKPSDAERAHAQRAPNPLGEAELAAHPPP